MEEARLVHPAFGHQKMEVRVGIDPVPEGLNGLDDPKRQLAPRDYLRIARQGAEGAAAKIAQEPALGLEEYPKTCGSS